MYQVDGKDKVIELKDIPQCSVGAPLPIVLSDEFTILLAYLLQDIPENWDFNIQSKDPIAVVEVESYLSFMFGMPNDEAFHGHPLYGRGLRPCSVFEIQNSSWIRKLEQMNSVHPHHKPEKYVELKHFIFAFHDSTFECIAHNFKFSIHECFIESVFPELKRKLFTEI